MPKLYHEISMSLDGFIAGPNMSLEDPLGKGGERLHEWALGLESWRETHGRSGGRTGRDDELMREAVDPQRCGDHGQEHVRARSRPVGRRPWQGWWGDGPPFHKPVFVLAHEREPLQLSDTTFTFATDGPEAALERARDAADDKDMQIADGASVAQQYLQAGLHLRYRVS
jgi:dihydrofolate reductase